MSVDYVVLERASDEAWVGLREICGYDEIVADSTGTHTAIRLLDRLLVEAPHTHLSPGDAANLTVVDRDRLLASVYTRTYGDHIASTVHCVHCGEPFDLDFSLQALLESLKQEAADADVDPEPDGTFKLPDGRRFRLPTGQDEVAVMHLPPEEAEGALLARCLVDGDATKAPEAVQEAMERVGPVLHLDLKARCRACDAYQPIHFDIQSYLLSSISAERRRLTYEIHLLASAYGWMVRDIMELPRSQRQMFAALIEAERGVSSRRWYTS